MSGVFNALTTAVSGINAQSDAFTGLSNNIANSQTVGYKATTTSFADYVAGNLRGNSTSQAESNTVQAVSVQHVDNAGTADRSTNALAMAVSGNGMFVTVKPTGATSTNSGQTIFSNQQYYTRNGDFAQDKKGYLVNTAGYYLEGYMADKTGTLSSNVSPINVSNIGFNPTATTTLTFNAAVGKLPADSTSYAAQSYTSTTTTAYDSAAQPHKIATQWQESQSNPLVWNLSVYDADGNGTIASNNYQVTFDHNGALASITDASSGKQIGSTTSGSAAEIPITLQYSANEQQNITLNLGTIGGTTGATMVSSQSTASASQATALTASTTNSATLSLPKSTTIGTTTGTSQSYMSSPTYITDSTTNNQTPVSVKWTQTSASPPTWTVQAVDPYNNSSSSDVTGDAHTVVFNSDGTMKTFDGAAPGTSVTMAAKIAGNSYTIDVTNAGLTTNSTLTSATSSLTNDSITSGTYTGSQIESDGSVMAQFDNGYSQLVGKIALVKFNNPNGLLAVDGQAYTATDRSGAPTAGLVGENGTGTLSVGYTEASTTDLTSDLSALIVAQEAYSANTKTVTTADNMLQQTIAMKQ